MNKKIKIILADDQKLFIDSLKIVMEHLSNDIEIIGTANSGKEVISLIEHQSPDMVLLDVRMPEMDGVETAKYLYEHYPHIKIVMLTTFDDDDYVQEALKYNAVGYILKDTPLTELISIISVVNEGTVLMSKKVATKILASKNKQTTGTSDDKTASEDKNDNIPEWYEDLTPRELEILVCVTQGLDNLEISEKLCIAEQTVKNHISIIYSKLGVNKRLQAMRLGSTLL